MCYLNLSFWLADAPHSFLFLYAVPESMKPLDKNAGADVATFLRKHLVEAQ